MTHLEALVHSVRTARRMTLGLLEGIAESDWLHQPVPDGQHVRWILGHLAIADDWALVSLGLPRQRTQLDAYFTGRPITPDPNAYPQPQVLREHFDAAHEAYVSRLAAIDETDLQRTTSGPIADFAPNLATLVSSHVWHEGFHGGQLALIRRSLGLPVRWG